MQPTPPGWYWDPGNRPGLFRWWDGHAWTEFLSANRSREAPAPLDLPEPGPEGRLSSGGLSVPVLPEPWRPCPPYPKHLVGAVGQELVVGRTPRGPYVGVVFVGAPAGAPESDLATATAGLARAVLDTYYPHEHPRGELEPVRTDVDGRPACRLVVALDIDDPNLELASETAVFVVVDLDGVRRGVLYASLPEAEHVPSVDDVIDELKVTPG
ncbi:MAG TPA: DUF2510 domain-containing protein [Marmoricola sp.]|jgi:hypothetical protein|nr:DUF2510 domain-containing protein [Marmoricola sp.]